MLGMQPVSKGRIGSDPFVTLVQPLVQEHAAFLAEEEFAFLYKADGQPFRISHLQGVRFGQGFVEETDLFFDLLFVDPDVQLTEQLIEIEFDEVALHFANFQAELHTIVSKQKRCHATVGLQALRPPFIHAKLPPGRLKLVPCACVESHSPCTHFGQARPSEARPVYGIANKLAFELNRHVMPTVAEQLRTAREAHKLTVYQVAETTKIRTDHIRALEDGNFDVFVAPVYIRGFVRTYATLLKLDVPQIMAMLEEELARTEKFSEPPPLSSEPRGALDYAMLLLSRLDWRKAGLALGALAVVAVIMGIYAGWRHFRTRDPLAGLPPAIYHPGANDSGETLPVTNTIPRR